jgi:Fic family protein
MSYVRYELGASFEATTSPAWPSAGTTNATWTDGAGTAHQISLALPAWIGELDPQVTTASAALAEDATLASAQFEYGCGRQRPWLRSLLIRAEAAASSRIEGITASTEQVLRAELGSADSPEATLIAANVEAIEVALAQAPASDSNSVRVVHRTLMASDPGHKPGEFRTELVWVGGHSPIGAVYLPPNHCWAAPGIEDVMLFSRRTNVTRLVQAAVAHAQFESVHPFSDGNGRVGRAMIGASLFRRGLTANLGVVPLSAGWVANPSEYVAALTSYRHGDIEPILRAVSSAMLRTIGEADRLRLAVDDVIKSWRSQASGRSGSQVLEVLELVSGSPAVTAEIIAQHLSINTTNAHAHIWRLAESGVLEPRPNIGRRGVWVAPEILKALDEFAASAERPGYGH